VEGVTGFKAIRPKNLKISHAPPEDEPHPDYMEMTMHQMTMAIQQQMTQSSAPRLFRSARGVCYDDDTPLRRTRKLVELLDKPDDSHTPQQTILTGEASKFYSVVGETNLQDGCTIYHLEHVAGILALAAMCQGEMCHAKGCGTGVGETVLLSILEAGPMPLDVIVDFLVLTPYIGPSNEFSERLDDEFRKAVTSTLHGNKACLTPHQSSVGYCNAMKGPICMLNLAHCTARSAVFHRLEQHTLFPLVIKRLLAIIAREAEDRRDGLILGPHVRGILFHMCMQQHVLRDLDQDDWVALGIQKLTQSSAKGLLLKSDKIQSYDALRSVLVDVTGVSSFEELKARI
jgi:hypothetical protein